MDVIEKFKTLAWFAQRPNYWRHAIALIQRKFEADHDAPAPRAAATRWAAERVTSVAEALAIVGLRDGGMAIPTLSREVLEQASLRARQSTIEMGGAGDLTLLHAATVLSQAQKVIETGVAYGWSSLAILSGMDERKNPRLVSVDMPYPKMDNDPFVGVVVPDELRQYWSLIREPDRQGVEKAILQMNGSVDLIHYDSDKSYQGRKYAYPLLWAALRAGGIFISDDIEDNLAFSEFVAQHGTPFAVTQYESKYIGITRKPVD